eukprot:NODE_9185_length_379_cov_41.648485_g8285_i0.p2 GENE.NODE_9185_length_379_cov_41.648485_g8285_i0~~NODE_9185_length_379_cov_41.648485_g8285_i0.p2  ORF type:complete len:81 (+),score=9.07 NODE_9185_length_379_cov_41.648485_g8285_i0:69-311(+)
MACAGVVPLVTFGPVKAPVKLAIPQSKFAEEVVCPFDNWPPAFLATQRQEDAPSLNLPSTYPVKYAFDLTPADRKKRAGK